MGSYDERNRRFEAVERFFEPDISLSLQNRHCAVVAVAGWQGVNEEVTATIEDYRAVIVYWCTQSSEHTISEYIGTTLYKRDLYTCMYTTVVDSFIQR